MADGTLRMRPLQGFEPDAGTERQFRDALGCFASGVTVVTAATADGGIGMTANSFSGVSLTPPLVLWCPARSSSRFEAFAGARHFAIHVLDAQQEDVALAFAKSGRAFDTVVCERSAHGVPLLTDCLARFECDTHALHDAGDHAIMVGHVRAAALRPGAPLVFTQGRFRRFDNEA